jgi:glycosyltransferase involved in cell wall biosynthesis
VNSPPFSTLSIGIQLKRRFPAVKLITEIRDDWLGYYLTRLESETSETTRRLARRMERQAIELSDSVIAVTSSQMEHIQARYPEQPGSKFLCVANGYDPDPFRGFTRRRDGRGRMRITYLGSVYTNPVYSPKTYLDVMDSLPEEIRSQIETRIVGRVALDAAPLFEGRRSPVEQLGFMPQEQAIRQLEEADYVLQIANDPTAHGGKMFDYIASGVPILAISPAGGEIDRLLKETRTGWCVDGKDPEAIRAMLLEAYRHFRDGTRGLPEPDRDAVEQFSWPNLVAKLVRGTGMADQPA